MNHEQTPEQSTNDFMTNVIEIIDRYKLKRNDRHQVIIYKRYYLYAQLKDAKLSLSHIGLLFDKDHATVINGLKKHDWFIKSKDQIYLHHVQPVINDLTHTPEPTDLIGDIMKCHSMEQLGIIKMNINRNYY
jgi:hypothetical protein